jgi:hypothetical protein
MEDFRDLEIERYRKQVKNLEELYNLINEELDVLNTMVEIAIPEDEYMKIRQQAYLLINEREEEQ